MGSSYYGSGSIPVKEGTTTEQIRAIMKNEDGFGFYDDEEAVVNGFVNYSFSEGRQEVDDAIQEVSTKYATAGHIHYYEADGEHDWEAYGPTERAKLEKAISYRESEIADHQKYIARLREKLSQLPEGS